MELSDQHHKMIENQATSIKDELDKLIKSHGWVPANFNLVMMKKIDLCTKYLGYEDAKIQNVISDLEYHFEEHFPKKDPTELGANHQE